MSVPASPPVTPAEAFLGLTERMLEHARGGRWERLAALQQRREALQRCLERAGPDPADRPALERAHALQQELERLAHSHRERIGSELRSHGRGRRMRARYRDGA